MRKNVSAVKIGQVVSGLYPKNGSRNILRRFSGKVLKKAKERMLQVFGEENF